MVVHISAPFTSVLVSKYYQVIYSDYIHTEDANDQCQLLQYFTAWRLAIQSRSRVDTLLLCREQCCSVKNIERYRGLISYFLGAVVQWFFGISVGSVELHRSIGPTQDRLAIRSDLHGSFPIEYTDKALGTGHEGEFSDYKRAGRECLALIRCQAARPTPRV